MLDSWIFLWWREMGSRRRNEQDSLGCDAELRGRSKKKKIFFFPRCVARSIFCDVCTLEENGTLASITISPPSSLPYLLREQLPDFRAVQ